MTNNSAGNVEPRSGDVASEDGDTHRETTTETLPLVRPNWAAPARVRALCTTRIGGVSEAPWNTLNLGLHVGDEATHVLENRRRLHDALALPSPPAWLAQVHGTTVVRIDAPSLRGTSAATRRERRATERPRDEDADRSGKSGERVGSGEAVTPGPSAVEEADGAWTSSPGVVLAVLTADCLPVVIADGSGSRVAVAHAGWRGLAGGVLDAVLAPFPDDETLHVWLGPAIGPRAFEVGAEVREAFVRRRSMHESAFVATGEPGKFMADLYALARQEICSLRATESLRLSGGDRCTVTERDVFHSHRRDGTCSGRMATLVWIDR